MSVTRETRQNVNRLVDKLVQEGEKEKYQGYKSREFHVYGLSDKSITMRKQPMKFSSAIFDSNCRKNSQTIFPIS